MQELRSELLSSSSPSPSSASQGWGSWQARPLCVNLCPLHTGSLLMGEKDRPEGERGQGRSPGKQPLRRHPHSPSAASSHEGRGGGQAPQCPHKNMANTLAVPQCPDPRCHSGKVPQASLAHTHRGPSWTLRALHTVLSNLLSTRLYHDALFACLSQTNCALSKGRHYATSIFGSQCLA